MATTTAPMPVDELLLKRLDEFERSATLFLDRVEIALTAPASEAQLHGRLAAVR
jgi:hypothetical protein